MTHCENELNKKKTPLDYVKSVVSKLKFDLMDPGPDEWIAEKTAFSEEGFDAEEQESTPSTDRKTWFIR
jgi:hypothetical protein